MEQIVLALQKITNHIETLTDRLLQLEAEVRERRCTGCGMSGSKPSTVVDFICSDCCKKVMIGNPVSLVEGICESCWESCNNEEKVAGVCPTCRALGHGRDKIVVKGDLNEFLGSNSC